MSHRAALSAAVVVTALLAVAAGAPAQELEPRAYVNTPVGLNFLIAGYAWTSGGISTDPALPIEDAKFTMHTGLLAYARSLSFWGTSGKIDVAVPYSGLSGSALVRARRSSARSRASTIRGSASP